MEKDKQIKKLERKAKKLRKQMNNILIGDTVRDFLFKEKSFNNCTYSYGRRFSFKSHFTIAGLITGIPTVVAAICMFFFNPSVCVTAAVAGFIATLFTNFVIPASLHDINKESDKKYRSKKQELEEVLNQIADLQGEPRRVTKEAKVMAQVSTVETTEKQEEKTAETNLFAALTRLKQLSGDMKPEQVDNAQHAEDTNNTVNEVNKNSHDYNGDSNFGF